MSVDGLSIPGLAKPDLAIAMVLLSGLIHAVVNAILKAGKDKAAGRAGIDGASALLMLPFLFIVPLPNGAWTWIAASALVHVVYMTSLVKAFEQGDMLVVYPIARGVAPPLAAGLAVMIFGEALTILTALGIGVVCSGIIVLGLAGSVHRSALGWALLTGASIASYTVLDAQGVRAAPTALSYIAWTFVIHGMVIVSTMVIWRGTGLLVTMREQWKVGLAAGALSIVTWGLAMAAFRWGATPALAGLRESSVAFGVIIAVVWLKERMTAKRLAGVLLILSGAGLIIAGR